MASIRQRKNADTGRRVAWRPAPKERGTEGARRATVHHPPMCILFMMASYLSYCVRNSTSASQVTRNKPIRQAAENTLTPGVVNEKS